MRKIYDGVLGFALQPWKASNGTILYFLNKYYKGRVTGKITLNKTDLKRLRQFLNERVIK